jgi:hypothetical protein
MPAKRQTLRRKAVRRKKILLRTSVSEPGSAATESSTVASGSNSAAVSGTAMKQEDVSALLPGFGKLEHLTDQVKRLLYI